MGVREDEDVGGERMCVYRHIYGVGHLLACVCIYIYGGKGDTYLHPLVSLAALVGEEDV